MTSVKTYLVEGWMLISHDRNPEWRRFKKYVRAVKPEDALETIYSILGSNHKLKRSHIRVEAIREVSFTEIEDREVAKLATLDKIKV